MKNLFNTIDAAGTGYVTMYNFFKHISDEISQEDVEPLILLFKLTDKDEDGKLNFTEFSRLTEILQEINDQNHTSVYTALFHLLDTENKGFLDEIEINKLYHALGYSDEYDATFKVKKMDLDGDGKIGLHDFLSIVC
ncbi:hypothetical protein EIN_052300 [Entamoeba invadens IP1]|uniref:hypothetical protein n=1 Tax=Entamoeba invadens IP1 TaxID=370355 RepID=UPI0002C3D198|nr:hypothetical protein EIN_052300 [Entamoeba invadens IP1]ELP93025.1 hypothetical protein EIN_052300 [Entamoeba invadens IP1]|eukprot:XP_004259796.1 hypothetical protein EIN_052300 [Entamoeba invadens IP1]